MEPMNHVNKNKIEFNSWWKLIKIKQGKAQDQVLSSEASNGEATGDTTKRTNKEVLRFQQLKKWM